MTSRPVILLLAPEPGSALARQLAEPGQRVVEARTSTEAEGVLARMPLDVVVADLAGGREAMSFLHVLPERSADLPLVAVGSPSTSQAASEALRLGAFETVDRDDVAGVQAAVARANELHGLRREVARLRRDGGGTRDRLPLLGRSASMRTVAQQVDEAANRQGPVLLVGGSGTGKATVAREIHARSSRAAGPFVHVVCSGLHDSLLESQIFGHRRGAFAGALHDHEGGIRAAAGGTLLLERVDVLPVRLQGRLHDVLTTGRVVPMGASQPVETDVRFIVSSTRELEVLARAGKFREDLFQNLNSGVVRVPLLRDRAEDIPFLAEAFAAEEAERLGVGARRFDSESLKLLVAHPWPSNVRELRAAVRHAMGRGIGETVRADHLPAAVRAGARAGLRRDPDRLPTLAESEAELVALVLEDSGGNKTLAARRLGIDRKRLYRKIRRYGLLGADGGEEETEGADEIEAD